MNKLTSILKVALALSFMGVTGASFAAYSSGSTGADGAFSPTASQAIQLPPDGVFNYTSVNIPSGVVITYIKNAANTPVTILATTDVSIAGTISVSATPPFSSADVSGAGLGGPGGYNGGRGGQPGGNPATWVAGFTGPNIGRAGIGPGAGGPGTVRMSGWNWGYPEAGAGGGGGYGGTPAAAGGACSTTPGIAYGNPTLIPLIGGSGGGGGAGGPILPGSGGGGGGGAILIAASGTINVTGSIFANGGAPVSTTVTDGRGATGGGGSGGAIRLIATTVSGNGAINAVGGSPATIDQIFNTTYGGYEICATQANGSIYGGAGRIRIETENLARTTATSPAWSGGSPSLAFVPGLPTLTIASIGGVPVPANPTGTGDVALPAGFTNPVDVSFVTSGVTVGSSIKLTITPAKGVTTSATSLPTTGTTSSATATVSVNLLSGPNTMQASVTYTVVASIGDAMSIYAMGERVKSVTLASTLGSKESSVTLNTVSGKQFVVPASVLAQFPS